MRKNPPVFRMSGIDETLRFGGKLGRGLRPGNIVCLQGPLGSGKTTFARGMLRGLRYGKAVTSPTFALVNEHRTKTLRVCHMDLYRLTAPELDGLGLEDYFGEPRTACLIEWPAAAAAILSKDRLEVQLGYLPGEEASCGRFVAFRPTGPESRALLRRAGLR